MRACEHNAPWVSRVSVVLRRVFTFQLRGYAVHAVLVHAAAGGGVKRGGGCEGGGGWSVGRRAIGACVCCVCWEGRRGLGALAVACTGH